MVNTSCPKCGGYFDSMVQEMCNTCIAEELTTIRAKLAKAEKDNAVLRDDIEAILSGKTGLDIRAAIDDAKEVE